MTVIADGFQLSIFILMLTLVIVIYTIRARNWTLPPSSGWFFVSLYFVYVIQQVARTKIGPCEPRTVA